MPIKIKKKKKTVTQHMEDLRKNLPILGEIVTWHLGSIEYPEELFQQRWVGSGLPEDILVSRRDKTAFTKALRSLENQNLIRKVNEDDQEAVYLVVEEERRKAERDIVFHKRKTIRYVKENQTIEFGEEVNEDDRSNLISLFERNRVLLTSADISKMLVTLVLRNGHRIDPGGDGRAKGGHYFVPKNRLDIIDKIESLFVTSESDWVGKPIKLMRIGALDNKEYRNQLRDAARKELLGEVKRADEDIRELSKKYESEGLTDNLLMKRNNRLDKIVDRARNLSVDLNLDFDEIKRETDKCRRDLSSIRKR